MEEQKILFADLFRLLGGIRAEMKVLTKETEKLLSGHEWDALTILVNGITSEAELIQRMAGFMVDNIALFLANGPYENQTPGLLPLESMARREA